MSRINSKIFLILISLVIKIEAIDWNCRFENDRDRFYSCIIRGVDLIAEAPITFKGNHYIGKGPGDVVIFNIESKSVSYLPPEIFEKFPNTQTLHVERKKLKKLVRNTFINAKKLRRFHGDYNELHVLGPYAFYGAINLEVIRLGVSQVREIDKTAFKGLTKLKEVNFGTNQIKFLDRRTFDSSPNLWIVYLDQNEIVSLWPDMFKHVHRFKFLYMEGNKCINKNFQDQTGWDMEDLLKPCLHELTLYEEFKYYENETHPDYRGLIHQARIEAFNSTQIVKSDFNSQLSLLSNYVAGNKMKSESNFEFVVRVENRLNSTTRNFANLMRNLNRTIQNNSLIIGENFVDLKTKTLDLDMKFNQSIIVLDDKTTARFDEFNVLFEDFQSQFADFQNSTLTFHEYSEMRFENLTVDLQQLEERLEESLETVYYTLNATKDELENVVISNFTKLTEEIYGEFEDTNEKIDQSIAEFRESDENLNNKLEEYSKKSFADLKNLEKSVESDVKVLKSEILFKIDTEVQRTDESIAQSRRDFQEKNEKLDSKIEDYSRKSFKELKEVENSTNINLKSLKNELLDKISDNMRVANQSINQSRQEYRKHNENLNHKLEEYSKKSAKDLKDFQESTVKNFQRLQNEISDKFEVTEQKLQNIDNLHNKKLQEAVANISRELSNLMETDQHIKETTLKNLTALEDNLKNSSSDIRETILEKFKALSEEIALLAKNKMDNFDYNAELLKLSVDVDKRLQRQFLQVKDDLEKMQESLFETMSATIMNITDYTNYTEPEIPDPTEPHFRAIKRQLEILEEKNFQVMCLVMVGLALSLISGAVAAVKALAGDDEEDDDGGGGGGGGLKGGLSKLKNVFSPVLENVDLGGMKSIIEDNFNGVLDNVDITAAQDIYDGHKDQAMETFGKAKTLYEEKKLGMGKDDLDAIASGSSQVILEEFPSQTEENLKF